MKLTKSRVEALEVPTAGQAFFWDEQLRGFGVRVTPSGARSYVVQGRANGRVHRVTLGAHGLLTCDQARTRAKAELLKLREGVNPRAEKKRVEALAVTLRAVADDYSQNRRTKKGGKLTAKTVRDIARHIKSNFGDWADKPITEITGDDCRTRFAEISKRSEAQANQAFRVLRALINFSIDEENPRFNPVKTLSKKGLWNRNREKTGYVPMEKLGAVWNMLQERRTSDGCLPIAQTGADISLFILLTGCRWSEAAQLTREHVNLIDGSWHLPDSKNHNPVTLPLPAAAIAMLNERPRVNGNPYLFPSRSGGSYVKDARYTMESISAAAGRHITAHDLRRTFITVGIKCKIELWKLKLLTNHISKGDVTLDHYVETSDLRYLADAVAQIADYIVTQGALAPAAAGPVQIIVEGGPHASRKPRPRKAKFERPGSTADTPQHHVSL